MADSCGGIDNLHIYENNVGMHCDEKQRSRARREWCVTSLVNRINGHNRSQQTCKEGIVTLMNIYRQAGNAFRS